MSNNVSLQADIASIPSGSLAVFGSVPPLLRALSADNVAPMAVLQVEALGSCFHINGPFARQVPDLLARCKSVRLERISKWVGWMAGDTASALAQTAGGRAASVLCLTLFEIFGENYAGDILFELSSKLLRAEQNQSSIEQLCRVVVTLSNKLGAIGFGTHLGTNVTRIREAYFNSNMEIPRTLLRPITKETMVEFLVALHLALTDDNHILTFEGCQGAGLIVAFVMALCPEDVSVLVEDEVIHQGPRRSIVISVKAALKHTFFGVETVLISGHGHPRRHFVVYDPDRIESADYRFKFKWDGCLAEMLDITFLQLGLRATDNLRLTIANLAASILLSMPGKELQTQVYRGERKLDNPALPREGFRSLLGPFSHSRVRENLTQVLRAEPSCSSWDYLQSFNELCLCMRLTSSDLHCVCSQDGCPSDHLADSELCGGKNCPIHKGWDVVDGILASAVVAVFVKSDGDAVLSPMQLQVGTFWEKEIKYAILIAAGYDISPPSSFGAMELHRVILNLVCDPGESAIGCSSGSSAIFPLALLQPTLIDPPFLEYRLEAGQFHDGVNYYTRLYSQYGLDPRSLAGADLRLPGRHIISSSLGAHSGLIMTARATREGLQIRTIIQISSKDIEVDFRDIHVGSIAITLSQECSHEPRIPLDTTLRRKVIPTSVEAPLASGKRISMPLTHCSREAQFLCCTMGVKTLLQSNCCLNCAVKEAIEGGFRMVIQS